jgi:GT2 family glycosyltransferase
MNRLPVVAAVPNYNMGEQLGELLPTLVSGGYDAVFVLDDASTDGSHEIVESLDNDIHFVSDGVNKGAGSNRNRILGALSHDAIIHFVDADTDLLTERPAEVARDIMPSRTTGFVGGLALADNNLQTVWNYGPRQSLWADAGAQVQGRTESLLASNPELAQKVRGFFKGLLRDWPDPLSDPVRRQVFWTIEQNFIIDSRVFSGVGGFDESLREHEIQDLAIRMSKLGLDRFFDPSLVVKHKEVDVREYNRILAMMKTEFRIARKHGFRNWLMPEGHFEPNL